MAARMKANDAGLPLRFVAILRTFSFVMIHLTKAFFHTKIDPGCQGESENWRMWIAECGIAGGAGLGIKKPPGLTPGVLG